MMRREPPTPVLLREMAFPAAQLAAGDAGSLQGAVVNSAPLAELDAVAVAPRRRLAAAAGLVQDAGSRSAQLAAGRNWELSVADEAVLGALVGDSSSAGHCGLVVADGMARERRELQQ